MASESKRLNEPRNPDLLKDSEIENEIVMENNFSRFLILDNIPVIPANKVSKLE